jgi:hypothetical protein
MQNASSLNIRQGLITVSLSKRNVQLACWICLLILICFSSLHIFFIYDFFCFYSAYAYLCNETSFFIVVAHKCKKKPLFLFVLHCFGFAFLFNFAYGAYHLFFLLVATHKKNRFILKIMQG